MKHIITILSLLSLTIISNAQQIQQFHLNKNPINIYTKSIITINDTTQFLSYNNDITYNINNKNLPSSLTHYIKNHNNKINNNKKHYIKHNNTYLYIKANNYHIQHKQLNTFDYLYDYNKRKKIHRTIIVIGSLITIPAILNKNYTYTIIGSTITTTGIIAQLFTNPIRNNKKKIKKAPTHLTY